MVTACHHIKHKKKWEMLLTSAPLLGHFLKHSHHAFLAGLHLIYNAPLSVCLWLHLSLHKLSQEHFLSSPPAAISSLRQEGVNIPYRCNNQEKIDWITRCPLASCPWHHYSSSMTAFHSCDPPKGTRPRPATHAENIVSHSQLATGCLFAYLCLGKWQSHFPQLYILVPTLGIDFQYKIK